jgi:hypothetical protein
LELPTAVQAEDVGQEIEEMLPTPAGSPWAYQVAPPSVVLNISANAAVEPVVV